MMKITLGIQRNLRQRIGNSIVTGLLYLAVLTTGISSLKAASGTITGDAADAQVNSTAAVSGLTATYNFVGGSSGTQSAVVYAFQIPPSLLADTTQRFASATFTIKMGSYVGSDMTVNGDLYGLGYSTVPTVLATDYYEGSLDPDNMLIQSAFLNTSIPAYAMASTSATALVNYLNGELATARADGAATAYVFLRVTPDSYIWFKRYVLGMNESGTSTAPKLDYVTETIPTVPGYKSVPFGGGGFVTGLVSDPTGADLYARTDVGGLYKWNNSGGNWTHLTDKIIPTTTHNRNVQGLMATMAVAVDPSNANNLYIAVGGGSVSGAGAGIYASSNKGLTWSEITTGTPNFAINGNGARAQGERLIVDPNNPNLIWYGSESSGLIKGVKSGSTWTWTQIPSTSVPFGTSTVGVTFVICDKNGSSTITYAGVYDSATTGNVGGVYTSTDGTTWTKVGGDAITKPARAAVASDGTLFVTGSQIVAKMPRSGTLAAITPVAGREYRGIAINSTGTVVYISEVQSGTCEIWRSASGGASGSWKSQSTAYFNNWNISASRIYAQEPDGTPTNGYQWFGNVAALWVNPSNVNELWASDFYGVQRSQNADRIGNTAVNTQPVYYRLLKNLEETVVFAVKNAPTGKKLITGNADVGGGVYAGSTTQSPFISGNGGLLNATNGKGVTSLDFSENNPNTWAYTWALSDSVGTGAVSTDGGSNWVRFGQIARGVMTNSTTAGWETFDLGSYLTKQRAKGVTTVTLIVAGAANWWEDIQSMSFENRVSTNKPTLLLNGITSVYPSEDTFVFKNAATTNYDSSTVLTVRGNNGYDTVTYLKFDLSGVSSISSAQLKLYRTSSTDTHTFNVGVHACANTTWTETAMTWNTRPYPMSDAGGFPMSSTPNYQQGGVSLRGGRIAVSATDPNVMVWAPIGSKPYYSEDRGVTWTLSTGAPATQITGIYTNGNSLGSSGQNLAADRVNGDFYLGTFGNTHSFYKSTDGGKNWVALSTVASGGTYNMRTPQLEAAPVSPGLTAGGDLWLCDDSDYNDNNAGGLWRSINGGSSWTKFSNIGRVGQVSFGKSSNGTGYAVYIHGENTSGVRNIYRSDDYGVTWNALNTESIPTTTGILSLTGDRQNYGKVFIGTGGRGTFEGQK